MTGNNINLTLDERLVKVLYTHLNKYLHSFDTKDYDDWCDLLNLRELSYIKNVLFENQRIEE